MSNNMTPVVRLMLIINVGVFILGQLGFEQLIDQNFALYYILGDQFQAFQLLTHMFLHANFSHVFFNMFGLFIFGPLLEMRMGSQRFLVFYLATGFLAGLLYAGVEAGQMAPKVESLQELSRKTPEPDELISFLENEGRSIHLTSEYIHFVYEVYPQNSDSQEMRKAAKDSVQNLLASFNNARMVGASGVIFGILMGVAMLFPNIEVRLLFFPFFPIKMKFIAMAYGVYEFVSLMENNPLDNVAHFAHLAGMLVAFGLIRYWKLSPLS